MKWRTIGAALMVALTLAACERTPERGQTGTDKDAGGSSGAPARPAASPSNTDTAQPRSILRPEIAETPTELQPKPAHAVISFGTSGTALDEAGRKTIDALLEKPVVKLGGPIFVRGHSDTRGSDRDNLLVSRDRAQSVHEYLLQQGLKPERIHVIALGETRPIAPNAKLDGSDDPAGRAKNRRVEIDIEGPVPAALQGDGSGVATASVTEE